MALTPITLTGHYELESGVPAAGSVDFVLTGSMKDTAAQIIVVPTKVTVFLDGAGQFSVTLLATDDPTTFPLNVPYQVTERIEGAIPNTYNIIIAHDAPGATLDISSVAQVTGQAGLYMLVALLGSATPVDTTTAAGQPGVSALGTRLDHRHHLGAHKASHATGGTDALAPADIAAATQADLTALTTTVGGKADAAATTAALATKADAGATTTALAGKEPLFAYQSKTADFAAAAYAIYLVNATTAAVTATLPTPGANVIIWFKNRGTANTLTINPHGAETLDGGASIVLNPGEHAIVCCDGTNWFRF